jgi:DNA ligase-1
MDVYSNSDQVMQIFNDIKEARSINTKKKLLRKHSYIKPYLRYALDPRYRYNITIHAANKAMFKDSKGLITSEHFNFLDDLRLHRISADNRAKAKAYYLRSALSFPSAVLFTHILNRSLRIGVSTLSINNVWPNTIFDFKPMLAHPYSKMKHKLMYPCFVSPKLDGVRAIYKRGKFYSRTGKEYKGLEHLVDQLSFVGGRELDGELIVPGATFYAASGLIRNKYSTPEVHYALFDIPSIIDTQEQRILFLQSLFKDREIPNCNLIPHSVIYTYDEAMKYYHNYRANGYEGAMLKNIQASYQKKRSTDWLKIKNIRSRTLRVIDVEQGRGKYADCVGALIIRLPNGGTTKVGSGLTDEDRISFLDRENIVGQLVEIEYHEVSPDGLREPRFKGVRYDKTEADASL